MSKHDLDLALPTWHQKRIAIKLKAFEKGDTLSTCKYAVKFNIILQDNSVYIYS